MFKTEYPLKRNIKPTGCIIKLCSVTKENSQPCPINISTSRHKIQYKFKEKPIDIESNKSGASAS